MTILDAAGSTEYRVLSIVTAAAPGTIVDDEITNTPRKS